MDTSNIDQDLSLTSLKQVFNSGVGTGIDFSKFLDRDSLAIAFSKLPGNKSLFVLVSLNL